MLQHTVAQYVCLCDTGSGAWSLSLQRTATNCSQLQPTTTHCAPIDTSTGATCTWIWPSIWIFHTLQHTATQCKRCNTLRHTATHCNTLHHTATYCNALHRTATHCNTLQQTATHCNTPTTLHLTFAPVSNLCPLTIKGLFCKRAL